MNRPVHTIAGDGSPTGPLIVLDLRTGAAELTGHEGLRATVNGQLRDAGRPEPASGHYRFLLIDTPDGLTSHQSVYEQAIGYGRRSSVLALVVGALPTPQQPDPPPPLDAWDPLAVLGDEPVPTPSTGLGPRLTRPAALQNRDCGLLWAGDLRAARIAGDPEVTADDPAALSVLVDVLGGLFDTVLASLSGLDDSVAVPAVRFLEHDLSPTARARAWAEALQRLAGSLDPTDGPARPELPGPVATLLSGPGSEANRPRRLPGGRLDASHRRCAESIAALRTAHTRLRGPGGLLEAGPGRRAAAAVEDTAAALRHHRGLILETLQHDTPLGTGAGPRPDGGPAGPEVVMPEYAGSREELRGSLRARAEDLLERGVALRDVSARLVALSEQVAPASGAEVLTEVEQRVPPGRLDRVSPRRPFTVRASFSRTAPPAFGAGLLSALAPWPGTLGALVVLLAAVGGCLRVGLHRPGGLGGNPLPAALVVLTALLPGTAAGVLLASAQPLPAWAPPVGLGVALMLAWILVVRCWHGAVDDWWRRTGATEATGLLGELDRLLADGAWQRWWAAEHRVYTADLARTTAGALRAAAATAEHFAEQAGAPRIRPETDDGWQDALTADTPDPVDGGWSTGEDMDPLAGPRWLGREAGDGGPALVDTLRGDLGAAVLAALEPHWSGTHRGQGAAARPETVDAGLRRIFTTARRHLDRHGVIAPPPFARRGERSEDTEALLGIAPRHPMDGLDDAQGLEPVELVTAEQSALLSKDPALVRQIRFAPHTATARPEAGQGAHEGQGSTTLATFPGRYSGTLRLTPLRHGVIKSVRQYADAWDNRADDHEFHTEGAGGGPRRREDDGTSW
ncbi:hypothetical protein [Streptomyces sp. NPDC126514]|uniref:hypothetical protein n=1 Tax=Streptomyces sp. NPDC126514 TaxID=3155210 RepID=UPI00331C0335